VYHALAYHHDCPHEMEQVPRERAAAVESFEKRSDPPEYVFSE